jgi:HK97 gp10 family phage protein
VASASVEFRPRRGWEKDAAPQIERFFRTQLGPRVEAEAKRLVPVDTGELHSSIGTVIRREATPVLYLCAGLGGRGSYAVFVELGTSRMRAQPYLRPAAFRRY